MYVEQLLLHVWNIAKPKDCWCDLMRKWINRFLHNFSQAAPLFPLGCERLTFDEESETSISGRGGKILKSSKTHLWLLFKPCFYSSSFITVHLSQSFFVCFVYPILALVMESTCETDAAGYNQPVEPQHCKLSVGPGGLEKAAMVWAWIDAPTTP